ncbi:MAG: hypothetical protein ACYCQJ_01595 [Nitrososphaerales archaeon]
MENRQASLNFVFSPGITPLIADLTVFGFILTLGVAFIFFRGQVVYYVIGVDTILIASFKFATDYFDFLDALLSIIAILVSIFLILQMRRPSIVSIIIGLLAIGLGVWKVHGDFFDPFDLVLSSASILIGLVLLKWAYKGID